jgi:glutaconyl-CoA decarboxylase
MKRLRITVGNKSYDVTVEDLTEMETVPPAPSPTAPVRSVAARPEQPEAAAAKPPRRPRVAGSVTSPMAGGIKTIFVKPGDTVKQGQALVVLEAMKMENQITAPFDGMIKSVDVVEGDSVTEGHVLLVLE